MTLQTKHTDGDTTNGEARLDVLAGRFGGRFLREEAPADKLPQTGMSSQDAMRLVGEELLLDGMPMRNLATFVTTWMEPEAQRLFAENLHATSSITLNTPRPLRSSSAASACSPIFSMLRGRRPVHARRGPLRRSCSALCR